MKAGESSAEIIEVEMHALIGKGALMGLRGAEFTSASAAVIITCGKRGTIRCILAFGMRSLDKTYYGKNFRRHCMSFCTFSMVDDSSLEFMSYSSSVFSVLLFALVYYLSLYYIFVPL